MQKCVRWFAAGLILAAGSAAPAHELDAVRIEAWVGAGPRAALLVVDFWPYNGDADSFAFGCRFAPETISGLELLDAVQAAGVGFSYALDVSGFLTDIWYVKGGTVYHTGYDWPTSYWSYWLSVDFGETWAYAPVGPADRVLADGATDGWLALPGDDWVSEPVTPLRPEPLPGDLNCDGRVDFADIDPFVTALAGQAVYEAAYPGCRYANGDCDGDGGVDFADIDPFVALLGG